MYESFCVTHGHAHAHACSTRSPTNVKDVHGAYGVKIALRKMYSLTMGFVLGRTNSGVRTPWRIPVVPSRIRYCKADRPCDSSLKLCVRLVGMPGADLASCLSTGVLKSHLFAKLTLLELLRFTQVSSECRCDLQHEDTWRSALARSLPAGHPLRRPTSSCQTAAFQYCAMRTVQRGRDAAVLTCALLSSQCLAFENESTKLGRSHGSSVSTGWQT